MPTTPESSAPLDYDEFYGGIYFTATKLVDTQLLEKLELEAASATYLLTILRVTGGELSTYVPEDSFYSLPTDHPLVPLLETLVGVTVPWADVPFELQSVFIAPQ